ncbi:MAG: T9SS type A sorting domain-containing protein [Bacteroidota bacterium]
MRSILFIILGLFFVHTSAQITYAPSQKIPVTDFVGNTQAYAWNGGMNNPLVSSVDINLDGNPDIVLFDRADETFNVYLNGGTANEVDFRFAPEYRTRFDSCKCSTWTLFEDYNCDGRADIFCGTQTGLLLVYENVIYNGDSVGFELAYDPLMAQYTQNYIPLAVPKNDIPAIIDMDDDGDLDILTPQNVFTSITYLQNLAVENFGRCDTLVFNRATGCWGHFFESSTDNTLFVGDTSNCTIPASFINCIPENKIRTTPPTHISNPRHAGTTLLSLDLDGNGLKDLLLGDISFSTVVATYNNGCSDYAFMDSVEVSYPQTDVPVDVDIFPGIFYEDIDNDGVNDLILAPNETLGGGETSRGMAWYHNDGMNDNPDFKFRGRTFIVDEQIDLGNFSSPAFFDYEGDGLMDILVSHGSAGYHTNNGLDTRYELRLYRNTGTLADPAYTLADSNFLGIGTQGVPLANLTIAAGDLDGDGDDDLLLGYQAGKIAYYENAAGPGQGAVYVKITEALRDAAGDTIDIGNLSAPELYDFDGDQDLDLFIGEEHGWINYYENTGSTQSFAFTQVSSAFGNIKLSNVFGSMFSGNSKPRIVDYDGDGEAEMFVGGDQGYLELYTNLSAGLSAQLIAQPMPFNYDFGTFSAPAIAVLDTSGIHSFVVGNRRGGLQLVQGSRTVTPPLSVNPDQDPARPIIFPNPSEGRFQVKLQNPNQQSYRLYLRNSLGQTILSRETRGSQLSLDLSAYPKGVYLLQVEQGDRVWHHKLVRQ